MSQKDCLFCKIVAGEIPCHKIYEDDNTLAFLDINPKAKYHTLVIPKEHAQDIFDISQKDLQKTIQAVQKISRHYKDKLGIENLQVHNNSGKKAGQEVMHLHFHIIPFDVDTSDTEELGKLAEKAKLS